MGASIPIAGMLSFTGAVGDTDATGAAVIGAGVTDAATDASTGAGGVTIGVVVMTDEVAPAA
jgi:hypothetical protein